MGNPVVKNMDNLVTIQNLKPGMVIVQIVAQNGPVKIRKSGLVTSADMVKGLAEMGVLQVEIDPEQTVEIEAPVVAKSQTQRLLESDRQADKSLDHSLSEQFNRSLFLPSVQELPNKWQFYGKQYFSAAIIVVGGFGLGWTGATYENWVGLFAPAEPQVVVQQPVVQQPSPQAQTPATSTESPNVASQEPQPSGEVGTESTAAEPTEPTDAFEEEQGIEITQVAPEPSPQISPELLRRFEQAISDIDEEGAQDDDSDSGFVESSSDRPMVHDLPAWVLTRLPSMAFSAHMYASDPSERWLRVNGKRLYEGQEIDDGLTLVAIEPQEVVLSFMGHEFSMPALSDW